MAMHRVLITGGAGFIGSSLAGALLLSKQDYHVTVLDNLSRGHLKNISKWLGSPKFEFVQADLLDYSASGSDDQKASVLQKLVDNSDIIFHLAANPDVAIGGVNTQIDFQQNVQATYILLEAIRKSHRVVQSDVNRHQKQNMKRVIFTSSSTVYGRANKRPTPEDYSPLYPISLYGSTKLACEAIISGYSHMFNIYCVVGRLANIIGPTNTHGVIYDFIKKLSVHPDFLDILGNGRQDKSYLYIDDCIDALLLLSNCAQMDSDFVEGNVEDHRMRSLKGSGRRRKSYSDQESFDHPFEVFNIGSDDTITVLDIAQIIIDKLSLKSEKVNTVFKNKYEDGRGWKGDIPDFWLDCTKIKRIGWKPRYDRSRDAVSRACEEYIKKIEDGKNKGPLSS